MIAAGDAATTRATGTYAFAFPVEAVYKHHSSKLKPGSRASLRGSNLYLYTADGSCEIMRAWC